MTIDEDLSKLISNGNLAELDSPASSRVRCLGYFIPMKVRKDIEGREHIELCSLRDRDKMAGIGVYSDEISVVDLYRHS